MNNGGSSYIKNAGIAIAILSPPIILLIILDQFSVTSFTIGKALLYLLIGILLLLTLGVVYIALRIRKTGLGTAALPPELREEDILEEVAAANGGDEAVPTLELYEEDILYGGAAAGDGDFEMGVLGGEDPGEVEAEADVVKQYINAEFVDKDKDSPLLVGEKYTLAFDVDLKIRETSLLPDVGKAELHPDVYEPGEDEVTLTFLVTGENFKIHTREVQKITVPRNGRSKEKAKFEVEPLSVGEGKIRVIVLKEGNIVQELVFALDIGQKTSPVISLQRNGRGIEAASLLGSRNVHLNIVRAGDKFKMMFFIEGFSNPDFETLAISVQELHGWINEARDKIRGVVYGEWENLGKAYLKKNLKIDPAVAAATIVTLAEAGNKLFKRIFLERSQDESYKLMIGEELLKIAKQDKLRIQIFSDHFLLPWGLLYMAEEVDPDNIDPSLFLGMSHIIEHIPKHPYAEDQSGVSCEIPVEDKFISSLNLNKDLDEIKRSGRKLVTNLTQDQIEFWDRLTQRSSRVKCVSRFNVQDVVEALGKSTLQDHLIYFYCHASSETDSEHLAFDQSWLKLSMNERISLGELKEKAPMRDQLPSNPLVFINACESAELSPLFYDGFVPYFLAKGARGVIGTECDIPAQFALEWALSFFDRFLKGQPVGETFLELRRHFYEEYNNILGLLYAVYINGDTRLAEPVIQN